MGEKITLLLLFLVSSISFAQDANELNELSKKYIDSREFEKAVPLLKQAAELGNAESQYNLGYCYQAGVEVKKDSQKAVEWYSKSAEQGWNDGLYAMMMAYGNGNGIEFNAEKAFEYALKCANNNDGTCMFNVINCYKTGIGIEKNVERMLEWATRLGKLENPENLQKSGYITSTRLNLAYMYRDGDDLEQNNINGYIWFLIYNEFKRDFSVFKQNAIIEEIQELEKKLSNEDKISAKIKAEEILERQLLNLDNLYKADY